MYEMHYEEDTQILHLRLTGFWTDATMVSFKNEFMPLVQKITRAKADFVVLSDCRDYPVQSRDILIAWATMLGPDPAVTAPYAIIVGSVLNKLQAERGLTAPNVKIFTSMEAGTAWLEASRASVPR